MQPLIKWPGGKSIEYEYIKDIIPPFKHYMEPFFGGGGVYFQLQPQKALVNDICYELIQFYKYLKGKNDKKAFKKALYDYVDHWEKIPQSCILFEKQLLKVYEQFKQGKITKHELKKIVHEYIERKKDHFTSLFDKKFCLDEKNLLRQIISNLVSKMSRTKETENQRGEMTQEDLKKNIETAFRSGFYMHFRDIMNFDEARYHLSLAKKIANYYFIREFCYGSMFRFNAKGHFNIPYGGIAYNTKNFRGKVDYLFSKEVENLLQNTIFEEMDFEALFNQQQFNKDDFIFLDPPYDTDFNNYENNAFDKKDQERLARCLYKTKANFILIIKKTPFIVSLYKDKPGITIESFEKKYMYNIKGRNVRDVEHLLIYNF